MIYGNQKTIKNKISCFGVGLHSGKIVNLTLKPANVDQGILFRRIDHNGSVIGELQANYNFVSDTKLNTTIASKDRKLKFSTIEHLMAALWGCGIDNVIVEVDNEELPIMDGSSCHFKFMIECVGIQKQNKGRRLIEILKTIEVSNGKSVASINPADNFLISMEIEFDHEVIKKQDFHFNSLSSSFALDLSRARTFGFLEEVKQLQKMGLGKGGNLDNVIIVDKDKIINQEGLRYENEFVRHKVLDSIGDLYLSGAYIKGHFKGFRSGHAINNLLLHKLFEDKTAYRIIQLPTENINQDAVA